MVGMVPGIGPPGAKIALVGEAPGQEEIELGLPFVGTSGKLLNSMLSNAGIDRSQCYITNVMKQRPPANDFGAFYTDKQRRIPSPMLLQGIESLKEELCRVKPNIIVPLGGEALRALTGKVKSEKGVASGPIMSWRGSLLTVCLNGLQLKICSTLHPAYVLRQYKSRVIVESDLKRVLLESQSPTLALPSHHFELNPTFDRVIEYLSHPPKRFAFDIETSGPFTRCLALSGDSSHAICIPFMSNNPGPPPLSGLIPLFPSGTVERNSHWSEEQEWEILHLLDVVFRNPNIEKIAQNFPFDALVLSRDFGLDCSPGFVLDTMVAHHTCFSELPKGLDYLASIYTRVPYYSDFDASVDRDTWKYNCYDAAVTFEIAGKLVEEMRGLGVEKFYNEVINPAIISYTRAETRGVLIDEKVRAAIKCETQQEMEKASARIIAFSSGKIKNPGSPDQLRDFVYGPLGCKTIFNRKTREPTIDKDARIKLRQQYPQHMEFFNDLDTHSYDKHLINGLLSYPLENGRAKTHYNLGGTVTGRLSSGKDKESGEALSEGAFGKVVNLQNVQRGDIEMDAGHKLGLRSMFLADPGYTLIKADLSQAEFRIVVWQANIRWIIDKYMGNSNYDIHRHLASMIFNKAPEDITKAERTTAKNGVYGGMYGMQEKTAAATYKLPLQTARFVLGRFHALVPEIQKNYWTWIKNQLLSKRSFVNPLGRLHIFFDRMEDDLERNARSYFAQSTVGCVINKAWNKIDAEWDDREAFPLLQVHDEIVALARTDKVVEYAKKLSQAMLVPMQLEGTPEPLIIPVEVSIGPNWYDTVSLEEYERLHRHSPNLGTTTGVLSV